MIGTVYNVDGLSGPRTAFVVATHDTDPEGPSGSVRVEARELLGGAVPMPRVVPCVASPPGDGSAAFVPAMAWSAP